MSSIDGTEFNDNDTISNGIFHPSLIGTSDDDFIYGLHGADIIYGGAGADHLIGGDGGQVVFDSSRDEIYGEAGTDFLLGGNGADYLDGGSDSDVLNGEDNADELYGGFGSDSLYGGEGDDRLDGGTVDEFDSSSDKLYGEAGDDFLLGGNGVDYLDGGTGADRMKGHYGNDTYVVDSSLDVIEETSGTGIETVISSTAFSLGADSKGLDHLTLAENISAINGIGNGLTNTLKGNNFRNTLDGRGGTDTLDGRGGKDILVGGTGNDTLTGGTGQDAFVFQSKNEARDRITDFSVVDDLIQVSKAGFGAGLNVGTLLTSQFVLGSSATNSSQRFIYDRSNGGLYFDADGNGATAKIQIASLSTGLSLTRNDISVVT